GTAVSARARGVPGDIAGKTGTTNEGRDAWFVGYSSRLLAVVWVGFDDGRAHGLTGAQAALPIWADFMRQALGAHPPPPLHRSRRHHLRRCGRDQRQAGEALVSAHHPRDLPRGHRARSMPGASGLGRAPARLVATPSRVVPVNAYVRERPRVEAVTHFL